MTDDLRRLVTVKPLEWENWVNGLARAETIFGTYAVWSGHWRAPNSTGGTPHPYPFAAAQVHYESQIYSVLQATGADTATEGGAE